MHARHIRKILLQQVVGTHHQVALLVAVDMDVRHLQVAIVLRGELGAHLLHIECIEQGHGEEHRLQVVITISTLLDNVQTEIDLCYRKCYH